MKIAARYVIVLSALLLITSAAQANTITAALDNPANNEGVAGNGTVNGWAFATNGAGGRSASTHRWNDPGRCDHSVLWPAPKTWRMPSRTRPLILATRALSIMPY